MINKQGEQIMEANNKAIEYSLSAKRNDFEQKKISSSQDAADYARQFYFDDILIYESMFIILINKGGKVIGWAKISQGGVASTVADVKIIAKYVVDTLASAAIIVHNHPSGNTNPSKADMELSRRVKNTLNLFDCQLLDSIILTEKEHYSMEENGNL